VYCQVVYICGCIPARIQHALADLPETLDETYQRTLREIKRQTGNLPIACFSSLQWLSARFASRNLPSCSHSISRPNQFRNFNEDWRLEDPVDAVLSTCSSLLAIVDGGYPFGKVIQFSHFSVKEF
jgi:hypothetical protein